MSSEHGPVNQKSTIAALLVGFQAVVSFIVALALFASAHRAARWLFADAAHRRLELGWAMMLVTLIAVVIAVALASSASWARIAALAFEATVVLGALVRMPVAPLSALAGFAIAGVVIWLVATSTGNDTRGNSATPTAGAGAS